MINKRKYDFLYFFAFIFGYGYLFLKLTMINTFVNINIFFKPILLIVLLLCLSYFLLSGISIQQLLYKFIFLLLTIIVAYSSKNMKLILIMVLVLFSSKIDFDSIVKISLVESIFFTLLIMLLSKLSIIPDLIYIRADGALRHSFGFAYTTVFASIIFYILCLFVYINWNKKIINSMILISSMFLLMYFCDARLSAISIVLLLFVNLCDNILFKLLNNKIMKIIVIYFLFPLLFSFSYLISKYYNGIGILKEINELLSGRLLLGHQAIMNYNPKLFGQNIIQYGNGSSITRDVTKQYFYIDSGYLQLLLIYGIFFTIFIFFLYINGFKNAYRIKNNKLILILMIILITNLIDPMMLDLGSNVFLISLVSNIRNTSAIQNDKLRGKKYEDDQKLPI